MGPTIVANGVIEPPGWPVVKTPISGACNWSGREKEIPSSELARMDKPLCFLREKNYESTHLGSDFLVVACCVWKIWELVDMIYSCRFKYSSRFILKFMAPRQCMRHRDTKDLSAYPPRK